MGHPKMYFLDVDFNPWRTEIVTQRFKEAGLEVERFPGVHGTSVGLASTTTVWDAERSNPYRISPGQQSIAITKMLMYQRILDRGILDKDDSSVLVFENDVRLANNFKEELAKSMAALPANWEAVHVGFCCGEGKPKTVINDRVCQIPGVLCCHALMFKRKAVEQAYHLLRSGQVFFGTPSDTLFAKRLYPKLNHYCFVPQLAFQDATDSEAAKMITWEDAQGWFDWQQIIDEQLTGFGNNKATFVEVGTWKGRSAIYTASEIKRRLKNVELICVDTWKGNADEPDMAAMIAAAGGDIWPEFWRNINRAGVVDYITPMRMTSLEAAAKFADRSIHFCFLDAGHSYEDMSADLPAWYPKMVPGSSMAGHDIARDGVRRAVRDFCRKIGKTHREWKECWIIDGCNA